MLSEYGVLSLNSMKLTTFFNSALVIQRISIITRMKYWLDVLGSNAAAAHRDLTRREMESLPFNTISFGKRLKFQVDPAEKTALESLKGTWAKAMQSLSYSMQIWIRSCPEFARTMEPCPSPGEVLEGNGGADPAIIVLATGLKTRSCGSPKQIQLGGADPATIILVTGCKSCRSSLQKKIVQLRVVDHLFKKNRPTESCRSSLKKNHQN